GEQARDLALGLRAVVDEGVANPAASIVRAHHLRLTPPRLRVGFTVGRPAARLRVREHRPDLAIRAPLPNRRLVPEQYDRLARAPMPKQTAQRLAVPLRRERHNATARRIHTTRPHTLQNLVRQRVNSKPIAVFHAHNVNVPDAPCWPLPDASSRSVRFNGVS